MRQHRALPLDAARLDALATRYVARYATTEAKLTAYLERRIAERGWAGEGMPPVAAIVARCVELGFVDDRSFAEARMRTLTGRGYGGRRIGAALAVAGIDRDTVAALTPTAEVARQAAQTYARRRRFGPFADGVQSDDVRRRHFAAMVRAGHSFELARFFTNAPQTDEV